MAEEQAIENGLNIKYGALLNMRMRTRTAADCDLKLSVSIEYFICTRCGGRVSFSVGRMDIG